MKRFGMMFALGGLSQVLMEEVSGVEGGGGEGGGATTAAPATKLPEQKPGKDAADAPPPKAGDSEVLAKAGFAEGEDKGANYALAFIARHGFTADNPAVQAALEGDFSMLKAELAQKGVQGWEQAIGLGEDAYGRFVAKQEGVQAEVGKVVTDIAERSGVDWEAAVQHVGGSASDEVKSALNNLLGNPATAAIAAGFITNAYLEGSNEEVQPRVAATGAASDAANKQVQGGKLSRAEYTKEMRDLQKRMGDRYLQSPEAQALYARLDR